MWPLFLQLNFESGPSKRKVHLAVSHTAGYRFRVSLSIRVGASALLFSISDIAIRDGFLVSRVKAMPRGICSCRIGD